MIIQECLLIVNIKEIPMKQPVKDHLWSSLAGAAAIGGVFVVASAAVVVAAVVATAGVVAAVAAAGVTAAGGAVASVGVVAGIAVVIAAVAAGVVVASAVVAGGVAGVAAATGALADKAIAFRPLSAIGGAALSLTMPFGLASHFEAFNAPNTQPVQPPEKSGNSDLPQQESRNVATAFNAINDNKCVTASINDNGQCILTRTGTHQKTYNLS